MAACSRSRTIFPIPPLAFAGAGPTQAATGRGGLFRTCSSAVQSLGVEYGRGIDLEDGQNLPARSRLVDRDTHEIEGRGVERSADIDDIDAGLPVAATGTCDDDQEQAGDKEGATHVSGG